MPRLLPHLMLIEVVESRFGCSMAGRYIDELMRGRYSDYLHVLYRELLSSRRPLYSGRLRRRRGRAAADAPADAAAVRFEESRPCLVAAG